MTETVFVVTGAIAGNVYHTDRDCLALQQAHNVAAKDVSVLPGWRECMICSGERYPRGGHCNDDHPGPGTQDEWSTGPGDDPWRYACPNCFSTQLRSRPRDRNWYCKNCNRAVSKLRDRKTERTVTSV